MQGLTPYGVGLVQNALLACFWYKQSLKAFLRRMHITQTAIDQLDHYPTKRDFIYWLFPKLEETIRGRALIADIAHELAGQTSFPDLARHENAKQMISTARQAVGELAQYLARLEQASLNEAERKRIRAEGEQRRTAFLSHQQTLATLRAELDVLAPRLGEQEAGYEFQAWFGRLASLFELPYRKPYSTCGRQIDGSVTICGMRYLLELKFTQSQATPADVANFRDKVEGVADYTMGILLSMSGFTDDAKGTASRAKTSILLMDYAHLYLVLGGAVTLPDLVSRMKDHASDTGSAYLSAAPAG